MIRPPIDRERYPAPVKLDRELAKLCEKRCICPDDPTKDVEGIDETYDDWCKENCYCRHYVHYESAPGDTD